MSAHPDDCGCFGCVVDWASQPCRRHERCTKSRNHYGDCERITVEKVLPWDAVPGMVRDAEQGPQEK